MAKILITGGTGLIGKHLTSLLQKEGHEIAILTRNISNIPDGIHGFEWNVKKQELDNNALRWSDHIIHLAGESVAGSRWTKKRKQAILNSRVDSTRLLYRKIDESSSAIKSIISASAVGYYPVIPFRMVV